MSEKAALFGSIDTEASPIGRLPKGAILHEVGRAGHLVKVELDKERFAFVKASEVKPSKRPPTPVKDIEYLALRTPPQIALSVDPSKGGVVAEGEKFALSGVVTNPGQLLDVYVLVDDQKVFFKGASGEGGELKFSTDLPLKEGNNHVLVVARESAEFASRKMLVVRRRPAAVAQKMSPTEGAKQ